MANFNFHSDLKNEIFEILENSGIKISNKQNAYKTLIDFLNLKSKILELKKRKILIVPQFEKIIDNHHKKKEILTIIDDARSGENINYFQSKRIIQSKQLDHLSSEWNIFHFHLSIKPDKDSHFAKRGDLLMFAYIEDDIIVFLGLDKHKDSFSNLKWLEILERNFPYLLEKFIAPDLPEIEGNFNTKDRELLWDSGVSSGFIKLNGKTYLSPGIGKVTSGYNIQIVMQANHIMNWITLIEEKIRHNNLNNNKLKLRIMENTIDIIDLNKETILFVFPSLTMKK